MFAGTWGTTSVPVLGGRWRDIPHAAAPSHARVCARSALSLPVQPIWFAVSPCAPRIANPGRDVACLPAATLSLRDVQAVAMQMRLSSEARLRSSAIASTSYAAPCGHGHARRGHALIAAAKVHSSQVFSGVSGTRRRIIMMRHAESEDATEDVRDHDRAITELGRSAAQQVL